MPHHWSRRFGLTPLLLFCLDFHCTTTCIVKIARKKPKKAPITKQLTKEETKRMVANASSATERAKALLASGKLKIEQKQR